MMMECWFLRSSIPSCTLTRKPLASSSATTLMVHLSEQLHPTITRLQSHARCVDVVARDGENLHWQPVETKLTTSWKRHYLFYTSQCKMLSKCVNVLRKLSMLLLKALTCNYPFSHNIHICCCFCIQQPSQAHLLWAFLHSRAIKTRVLVIWAWDMVVETSLRSWLSYLREQALSLR